MCPCGVRVVVNQFSIRGALYPCFISEHPDRTLQAPLYTAPSSKEEARGCIPSERFPSARFTTADLRSGTIQRLVRFARHRVRGYGLRQEFITPHSPEQNGMVERVIRTLKDQCMHRHRFETLQHASRVIGDWIAFYNNERPHQSLGMKTPAEAFKLAA